MAQQQSPTVRNVNDVSPITCPCGDARRIFSQDDQGPVGIHRVTISHEAQRHYHKKTTEYYIILEGEGEVELNDERVPVKPGDVVYIPPFTRHVARGNFEIINVVHPPFDPSDEYLDE
ncbi:MAG: cupin domain-containing protein [Candidatus Hydrogenedentota bacterium]